MATSIPFPRKRRTRGHVIADLSMNHLERFIYAAGFTAERVRHDYGYDLLATTYDPGGYLEVGQLPFQVKATEKFRKSADGQYVLLSLRVADLNNWLLEPMPVFLVVYEAATRRSVWLYVQRYFRRADSPRIRPGADTVTARIPKTNRLSRKTIASARLWKNNILNQTSGTIDHG